MQISRWWLLIWGTHSFWYKNVQFANSLQAFSSWIFKVLHILQLRLKCIRHGLRIAGLDVCLHLHANSLPRSVWHCLLRFGYAMLHIAWPYVCRQICFSCLQATWSSSSLLQRSQTCHHFSLEQSNFHFTGSTQPGCRLTCCGQSGTWEGSRTSAKPQKGGNLQSTDIIY